MVSTDPFLSLLNNRWLSSSLSLLFPATLLDLPVYPPCSLFCLLGVRLEPALDCRGLGVLASVLPSDPWHDNLHRVSTARHHTLVMLYFCAISAGLIFSQQLPLISGTWYGGLILNFQPPTTVLVHHRDFKRESFWH